MEVHHSQHAFSLATRCNMSTCLRRNGAGLAWNARAPGCTFPRTQNDRTTSKTARLPQIENVMHLLICYLLSEFLALATARNSVRPWQCLTHFKIAMSSGKTKLGKALAQETLVMWLPSVWAASSLFESGLCSRFGKA